MKPRLDAVVCLVAAFVLQALLPQNAHLSSNYVAALPATDHRRDALAMGVALGITDDATASDDTYYNDGGTKAADDGTVDDGTVDDSVTDDAVTDDAVTDDAVTDDAMADDAMADDGSTDDGGGGGNPTSPTVSPSASDSNPLTDDLNVEADTSRLTCRAQGKKCSDANACCDGLKCVRNKRGKRKCKAKKKESSGGLGSGNGNNGNKKKCKRKGRKCGGTKKCCSGLKCRKTKDGNRKCK